MDRGIGPPRRDAKCAPEGLSPNYNVGMNSRPLRLTRRYVAAMLAATPLLAQVTQKTPPQGAPAPAPPNATPAQKLQKASADVRQVSDRLAQMEVPMDVEPAFAFRP
jgi:hypothetical protein